MQSARELLAGQPHRLARMVQIPPHAMAKPYGSEPRRAMRHHSAVSARRGNEAPRGGAWGAVRIAARSTRCTSAMTPPASAVTIKKRYIHSSGKPTTAAAASFTSPPPIRPRWCKITSTISTRTAAASDAAAPDKPPSATRPMSPTTAIATAMPSGMMRAATSAKAATINRHTRTAAARLADHTSAAPVMLGQTR